MKTRNLLLEIGTEEIPAGYVPGTLNQLALLADERLTAEHLSHTDVRTVGTPRRLTLMVPDLAERQPDRQEVLTGPPAKVAFTPEGNPTKAAEGFARGQGVGVSDLKVEDTERGPYVVLRRTVRGKRTMELLPGLLTDVILALAFPKTMRWGTEHIRFARPVRWIVALYGEEIIPFTIAGVQSGAESRGHRFMSQDTVKLTSDPDEYFVAMERHFVLADPANRRARLIEEAHEAAALAGGSILPDDALVEVNTHLTEFPTAVCGSFDERFLALPREVLITAMREHQKYFAVVNNKGQLMPNFVAVNNTRSPRPELVTQGHERVLRARLTDAAFFFEDDRTHPLGDRVPDLSGMVFHQRLGTLLDKTRRIQSLARYLAKQIDPRILAVAERAAWLAKTDLLTEMVGEFPSLQGTMGREYALLSGERREVAEAIAEHYLPVRAEGELPATLPGVIVSIADKIDTICGSFALGLQPSGTADPYGLRRQALGVLRILLDRHISLSLKALVAETLLLLGDAVAETPSDLAQNILAFFGSRFAHDLATRGFQADVVEAAMRVAFDDVEDCKRRAEALAAVRTRPEFEPLSLAFKRVMNILKGFDGGAIRPSRFDEEAEKDLYAAYLSVEQDVREMLSRQAYEQALATLLSLKPQIDAFFDRVMVMAEDPALKANRLALLWHIARLFLGIGDLSAVAAG